MSTKRTRPTKSRCLWWKQKLLIGMLLFLDTPNLLRAEATAANVAAFEAYTRSVEARLAAQHRPGSEFLVTPEDAGAGTKLLSGESLVARVSLPGAGALRGALLHHWRGTGFAPGAHAEDFERVMRDFRAYPRNFAPEVLNAGAKQVSGDHMLAWMRVRQHHVITVVMDSDYDVTFGRLDAGHGYSISRSTRIAEIAGAGTGAEHALAPEEEHGFLWRLNTYWSYEERDGGLYVQIETVSLTRSVPSGLGWAVRPYVESIPRESIEFTLRSACASMEKGNQGGKRWEGKR